MDLSLGPISDSVNVFAIIVFPYSAVHIRSYSCSELNVTVLVNAVDC
jgi:hypothetical protein